METTAGTTGARIPQVFPSESWLSVDFKPFLSDAPFPSLRHRATERYVEFAYKMGPIVFFLSFLLSFFFSFNSLVLPGQCCVPESRFSGLDHPGRPAVSCKTLQPYTRSYLLAEAAGPTELCVWLALQDRASGYYRLVDLDYLVKQDFNLLRDASQIQLLEYKP